MLAGCLAPRVDADFVPDGGGVRAPVERFSHDAGTDASRCPDVVLPPASVVDVVFRTAPFGGRFSPRNVGAVWIEDEAGRFVRTLEQWGQIRQRYLVAFLESSDGNVVDAVTGATLRAHERHAASWDLRDAARCPVGGARYRVRLELTDRNGPGASLEVPFELRPGIFRAADTGVFHDVQATTH